MAQPASAEWDTVVDRGHLVTSKLYLQQIENWTEAIELHTRHLPDIAGHTNNIATNTAGTNTRLDSIYAAINTGQFDVEVTNFDEITVHIDEMETLTQLLVDNTLNVPGGGVSVGRSAVLSLQELQAMRPILQAISDKLDTTNQNTDPGSGGGGAVAPGPPDPGVMPAVANPVLVPVQTRGPVDFYYNAPDIPDFEPGDDLVGGEFDFTAPTRSGLSNWTINVPTGQLGAVFGMSGQDLTFSTDLAWYGGTLRTTIHGAILALCGLWGGLFIFEEFRRYA